VTSEAGNLDLAHPGKALQDARDLLRWHMRGVQLVWQTESFGSGVRWTVPRERRERR
jgi:hypothetical protein